MTTAAETVNLFPIQYAQKQNLVLHYETEHELLWAHMRAQGRPCFTQALLRDLLKTYRRLERTGQHAGQKVAYHVLASDMENAYNLGGDLQLFRELIERGDRQGLADYAKACIDPMHIAMNGFGGKITFISLVQGDALGGGFEAALSADVLIAERSAKLGLPEILFNLFPGMGAYSVLSRKIGGTAAKNMILSGRLYSAAELHEMGVVDILAEDGMGELAVYDYIDRENRSANGYRGLREAIKSTNPVTYEELAKITEVWVDSALKLQHRDLRMMERLVARQQRRQGRNTTRAS